MSGVDIFKNEIVKLFKKEGLKLDISQIDVPRVKEHGDYAVPCFIFARDLKKSPQDIALNLRQKFEASNNKLITKISNLGPFLNFTVDKTPLAKDLLVAINSKKESFTKQPVTKTSPKVMVEFCSPNTNKPLHLGHIRNMLLGQSVADLLSFNGNKVTKANLINDRGIHICKSMLAYQKWGENTTPSKAKKKGDHLVGEFYVLYAQNDSAELEAETKEMLQKWEAGDKEVRKLWKEMNGWVYEGFNETFEKLGISFDKFYHESNMYDKGKDLILKHYEAGTFKKKEGAIVAPLEKKFKIPDKVLIRSDGTTIYMTQDIFLATLKIDDYKLDSSIYVVGSEQNLHFQQLFKILELMGYKQASKCFHLSYGMVNLPEGKMKSREGTVVDADDLIDELTKMAKEEIKKRDSKIKGKELDDRAKMIALGGLKFYMLKQDPVKEMTYNPKESLSFEGETGPYVQYTAVRIASIIDKIGKGVPKEKDIDFSRLEESEFEIVTKLSSFEEVVSKAGESNKPSLVANYLIDLCQAFNTYYHSTKILDSGAEAERLYMINAVRQVIIIGLRLLGIEVPEKM